MQSISVHFVSHLLTDRQKQQQFLVAINMDLAAWNFFLFMKMKPKL
jgi:hypothetical protein